MGGVFTELHFVALAAYGVTASLVLVALFRLPGGRMVGSLPLATSAGAVGIHFFALVAYAVGSGTLPLAGLAPSLSSLAFLVGLIAVGIQWLTREAGITVVAGPLAVILLAGALMAGFGPVPAGASPQGGWFVLHTATSFLGIALLMVAFAAAALYLLQHRELKGRRFGATFWFLPPLEQVDRLNHLALLGGLPALTVGVLLALVFGGSNQSVRDAVGAPHLVWGTLSWLVVAAVAVARLSGWVRGRRAAWASIAGFATVALAYIILVGLRAGGTRFL